MRKRNRIIAVISIALVAGLVTAIFVSPFAKADDLVRTDVGRRDVPVYQDGNAARGEISVRAYASQFDADGDGDVDPDSQRAVGRSYKVRGALRIKILSVRLQRHLGDGIWETLKSAGPKNSYGASSVAVFTDPPTQFVCDRERYRVQVRGLVRWTNNSLNSFNVESHHWSAEGEEKASTAGPDCLAI